MTEDIASGVYIIRVYILPILLFFLVKNNENMTVENVKKILKVVFIFYTILSVWGIFQAYVLGDTFLLDIGYPTKYKGRLRNSFYFGGFGNMQRVVSTFANANVFACVLGFIIIVSFLNIKDLLDVKRKKTCFLFIVGAFFLTFSRSNWLSMIVILLILAIYRKGMAKKIGMVFASIVIVGLIFGKISGVDLYSVVTEYLQSTITLEDDSASGRFEVWGEAIEELKDNPLGIGLGKVGARSAYLTGDVVLPCESSYLAVSLDTGIQGALLYFAAITSVIINMKQKMKKNYSMKAKRYFKSVNCLCIYILIMFAFSNHIYDLEIMLFFYFFVALAFNRTFIESLESENKLN